MRMDMYTYMAYPEGAAMLGFILLASSCFQGQPPTGRGQLSSLKVAMEKRQLP